MYEVIVLDCVVVCVFVLFVYSVAERRGVGIVIQNCLLLLLLLRCCCCLCNEKWMCDPHIAPVGHNGCFWIFIFNPNSESNCVPPMVQCASLLTPDRFFWRRLPEPSFCTKMRPINPKILLSPIHLMHVTTQYEIIRSHQWLMMIDDGWMIDKTSNWIRKIAVSMNDYVLHYSERSYIITRKDIKFVLQGLLNP